LATRASRLGRSPPTGRKLTFSLLVFGAMTCTSIRVSSGARASRPQFDRALAALETGDTLVITTLDRLGRSTQNMLDFAGQLRDRGAGLRVLNLGGGDVDTSTPMGSMLFTVMAALAQMEHEIKRERVVDSISKRRAAGKDLGGRPRRVTDSQIRSAMRLVQAGEPAAQVARDLGMSRATFYRRSRSLAN
jgi:DNA invertase Pin-like site-specific DNA recombinase